MSAQGAGMECARAGGGQPPSFDGCSPTEAAFRQSFSLRDAGGMLSHDVTKLPQLLEPLPGSFCCKRGGGGDDSGTPGGDAEGTWSQALSSSPYDGVEKGSGCTEPHTCHFSWAFHNISK